MSESAVLKIFATTQDPDYDSPWHARTPDNSTGSGVVIAKNQILTGAHVVANATFIQVQKMADPVKCVATVKSISHDCDLALLEVQDPAFLGTLDIPELGTLPHLRDRVSVIGFPIGGDEVSITEGVVSRIEVQRYSHSQRELLAVTVDAAINKGNSGGPVFKDGKVVGIAFQKLDDADGIGEMVPPTLIRHFLACAQESKLIHIPALGISTQTLENPDQRTWLGMGEDQSGVLCLSVDYNGSAWDSLKFGDVVLSMDGNTIANNATIHFRNRYRTRFDVILGEKHVGEDATLTILRDKKVLEVSLRLKAKKFLVPNNQYEHTPRYYIYGGLVFQPLTRDYLEIWNNWSTQAPDEFLLLYWSGVRSPERQEVIVLSQVLADQVNVGYGDRYNESIVKVDGVVPRDMNHFVELMEASQEFVMIQTSQDGVIVLDRKKAKDAGGRILARYRINQDRSPDLIRA